MEANKGYIVLCIIYTSNKLEFLLGVFFYADLILSFVVRMGQLFLFKLFADGYNYVLFLYCNGVTPVTDLKDLIKYAVSTNPNCSAISAIDMCSYLRYSFAFFIFL